MSTIQELFQQAQLDEAAYANFSNPDISIRQALINEGMSGSQADALRSQWRVVSQFSESGLLSNGFSATLLERLDPNQQPTGQYTFAIRGSDDIRDFAGADLDLAVTGVARNQLVSMVNYVLRLKAGENGLTQQLTPSGTGLTSNLVSGVGPGINPSQLTVSGHSLGGYLSQVYQRIFGSAGVYTYNALGIVNPNASIFDRVTGLLGLPAGRFSSGPGENLLVPGEPAQLIGTVQGKPQIQVFSETQSTMTNPINTMSAHRIAPLTDSLALYDLFANLDPVLNTTVPAVGMGKITDILKAASNKPAFSLEATLDSLRKLFKDPNPSAPTIVPTVTDNREQYYQNLIGLQDRVALYADTLTIDSLATTSDSQLAGLAQGLEAIAYRYALKELNPFAIVGNNDLYAPHNVNGELNLYGPVTGTGLTREFLSDRAEMLSWKNLYYQKDVNVALRGGRTESYEFTDRSIKDDRTGLDLTLKVVGRNSLLISNPARIIFGSDSDETLVGSDIAAGDRLYGGGGDDTLQGNQGNDYLEGGRGNDTYVWNTGDGFDTTLDTDGIGRLVVNGRSVSGGIKAAQGDYVNAEKLALHFEGDPIAGGVLVVNGDLKIENFTSGDLGIVLSDQGSLAEIQTTTRTYLAATSVQSHELYGSDGNDRFIAGDGISLFLGKAGEDLLEGHGFDHLRGGAGDDVISVAVFNERALNTGDLILSGGPGSDIILGGVGGETIYGDMEQASISTDSTAFYIDGFSYDGEAGEGHFDNPGGGFDFSSDEPRVFPGGITEALDYVLGITASTDLLSMYDDFVDGGPGPDLITGGHGSDILIGGDGDDRINGDISGVGGAVLNFVGFAGLFGSAGDDYLDGGGGNDRLADVDGGNDKLVGGPGDDNISSSEPDSAGTSYSNYLEGGEGNDVITSSNRSPDGFDVLIGGPGNDTFQVDFGSANIEGGAGSDTYNVIDRFSPLVPSRLPRNLVINDFDSEEGDADRLHLRPLADLLTAISITRDESNLYIGRGDDPGWITVENWFAGPEFKIEEIVFDNATTPGFDQVYDVAAIESRFATTTAAADFLWGSSADEQLAGGLGTDTLFGDAGNDILAGNEANDALDGGEGSDVYVFNIGDGVDHILDSGSFDADGISFSPGITPDMLTLNLGSLLINIGGNGDAIHLDGFDPNDARNSSSIEYFQFADGATLTYLQLVDRGFDLVGTDANDVLAGTSVNDRIDGLEGDDTLGGGAGNDVLRGAAGNDTYIYGLGSGIDTIDDGTGNFDTIVLGSAITPERVTVTRAGDFLTLGINDADRLAIRWQPQSGYQIEQVQFTDGMMWDAATLEVMAASSTNTAPTVANPLVDQTAQEDAPFGFQVPEDAFNDPGDMLTYSASAADGGPVPAWLSFDPEIAIFAGTPANDDVGAFDMTVAVTDSEGVSVSDTFRLTVANTNDRPVLGHPIADQSASAGVAFDFTLATDAFRDIDGGDVLAYRATLANGDMLPAWLSFDAASRNVSGTPAATDAGAISIRVTASDLAGTSAKDDFQLFVSDGGKCHEVNPVGMDHYEDRGPDHGKRNDERHRKPDGVKHDDRDDDRSDHKRDRMAECLAAYVESKPRYDFEVLAEELERLDRHGEALNAQEIARRWQVVGRYSSALSNEHEEDARGGADYRFNNLGLLGGGAFSGGFGYSGSTGTLHRVANLQTLQGLEEGFQRVHS